MAAEGGIPIENQIKVLYFSKTMEGSDVRNNQKLLKQKLNDETERFLSQNNIALINKDKFKQLIRNLSELIEHNEV